MNTTETKHTPGPWTHGTVMNNKTRYTQPVFSNGKCICVVYGEVNHVWTDEDRDNVCLIVAAPTLLSALRKIANHSSYTPPESDNTAFAYDSVREIARAAIVAQ